MSRILIITPAARHSRKGNRVTADRWASIVRSMGHHVSICQEYDGRDCDMMVALHARQSASSAARFAREYPERPLVVTLTGTDLYQDLGRSAHAQASVEMASRLILLQPRALRELPLRHRRKATVIVQSASIPTKRLRPLRRHFEVCVSGHLRSVKDPFRTALASRRLPVDSEILVTHIGAALSPTLEVRALNEMARNPRYRWLGNVPHWRAVRLLARSRLMVLSSKAEGGPSVVSEAIVSGVPVLATPISAAIGLLGDDYPGFFPVGDTRELARLLVRCEQDEGFYKSLAAHIGKQAPRFTLRREKRAWRQLLQDLLR